MRPPCVIWYLLGFATGRLLGCAVDTSVPAPETVRWPRTRATVCAAPAYAEVATSALDAWRGHGLVLRESCAAPDIVIEPYPADDIKAGTLAYTIANHQDGDLFLANIYVGDPWGSDFDLQSTLTHELGHALGLRHSEDPEATMWPVQQARSVSLRDLNETDIEAMEELYATGK